MKNKSLKLDVCEKDEIVLHRYGERIGSILIGKTHTAENGTLITSIELKGISA